MFARAAMIGGVALTVALGGCSLTPTKSSSSAGFTGAKALVATALNLLASDANSTDGADICKNVLASKVRSELNKVGSCATIVDDQIKTTDDSTLNIESIKVTGATASARVQTVHDAKKVISTVTLVKQSGSWRVAAI